MKLIQFITLFFCLFSLNSLAQTPYDDLPIADKISVKEGHSPYFTNARLGIGTNPTVLTTGPEQQCNSAIPVCQNIYSTTASYSGNGTSQEIPSNTCLGSNELNSVWYTFTSSSAGNIAFNITPNVIGQDYDFALYNITGTNCSAISSGALTPIRCNFSATGGVTGLSASGTNPSEPASGPNQSTVLATTVGQTYVLIISNYSSSSNGYQLNFTPGTASIFDVTPPTLTSVSAPCGSNVLTLNTSEQITCASIAANGSDISISGTGGPYTISGATGVNCGSSTAQITFTISPALTGAGPWVLNAHTGSDGNSFIDNCGNAMPTTTVGFNVAPATPVITGPANVCKGSTFALSSSAAVSYTWTGAAVPAGQQNQQTITVTASTSATMNFQLVVSYGACGTATVTKAVTVTDAPIANFTALPSLTVCAGTPVTFTNTSTYPCSTGGLGLNQCTCGSFLCSTTSNQGTFATYLWSFGDGGNAFYLAGSPAANFSPVHTYTAPGTYNVSLNASGLINTCSNTKNLTITVLPATPVLTVSPTTTICPSQSSTLTATGGTTYTWTPGATLNTVNGGTVIATPTITTTYSVSSPGCSGNQTSTVQVVVGGTPPVIGAINGSTLICPNSTGVTYSVANVASTNYTWSVPAGATITSAPTNSNAITVNFGATAGTVSVTAVGTCGTATASIAVSLSPALNLTVTPNNTSICAGSSTTLTASGATNYTWSPSATLNSANGTTVSANPVTATTYTVVGATGTCTGTTTATVSINPSLSLTVTPNNSSICAGSSETLTASGATNYTWSPSATLNTPNGASVIASPSVATTYTVIGSTGTCTGSATATITMGAALTLTLSSNTPTVCPGGSALLDANGATTYTWFPSATLSSPNGSNVTASPLANTIYTVLGSTGTCTGVATVSVGIGVCVSSACNLALIRSTLTNAGNIELLGMNNSCSLYFINPQFMTGPQAQTYAQSFGANLISVQSATENADLVQALSNQGFSSQVIWIGYSDATTEGSFVWYDGAPLSYSNWAPGEPNDAGGNEDCTQIYPDGSWNDLNCSGYNSLSVIEVNICPQVSVVNIPPTHCPLTNVTMNASTLLGSPNYTYTWVQSGAETFTTTSTGSSLNDQITVTSTGPNTFTVFTEDRYSCPQSTTVSLNVFPTPTITANTSTICLGQQTATLTANGASTYTWIPGTGLSSTNGAVVTGTPGATQNYTVIGTDANGCVNGTVTAITVNPIPNITVSPNVTICPTTSTVLTASGTTSYTWSPATSLSSANGATVTATPTVPTIYTVQGSSAAGCIATGSVSVNVSNNGFLPNVYIVQNNSTCDTSILNWLNVTSVTPSLAQGNLPNGVTFTATHSGGGLSSTPSMFSGATFPATYSVPIAATTIRNDLAGTFNFCFSQPVINPQIAFASIGQAVLPITITTGVPYQVLWTGTNMTYVNSTTLIGAEGFTIIRFPGTHSCISFDYSNNETYINLAFGVMDAACQGQPICPGTPIELVGNGATSYTWSTGANTTTITPSPLTTTTYSLSGANSDGCINTAVTTVTVNPTPTITVNNATICAGQQTATLTANGVDTYTWSAGLSATSGSVVTGTPASTQNYTVSGTDVNGCITNTTSIINVNPLPTVTVNSASICIGQQTATLTANGANTYSWTPSTDLSASTGSLVTGTPTITQSYSVTGTDINGCFSGNTSTITVNTLPTVTVNSSTICLGQQTATLTANGATTYSWIPGTGLSATTGSVVTGTPGATQNYTVAGMDANGCINGTVTAITVNPLPTVTVNSATICVGQQTATLTANGADTYTWSAGLSSSTGSLVTGNPVSTQNYTVTGTDLNGCFNATTTAVDVNPLPVLVTSPNSTVCPLSANTLTVGGAATYTWSPNIYLNTNTAANVICTPSVTTTYTIDATSALTCTNTTVLTIVVNNTVVVNATATTPTICPLATTALNATGATSYTWSPSISLSSANGGTVTSSTSTTETYTVIGATGTCTNSATVVVTATTNPIVSIVSSPSIICSGTSSNLTASGANTYTWSPATALNTTNGSVVNANPNSTQVYSVTGTSPLGCLGSTTTTLIVVPTPTVSALANPLTICAGSSSTLSAFGASNYAWSPAASVSNVNGSPTIASPAFTTTYTVIGTNGTTLLCNTPATVVVVVTPNTTLTPSPDVVICEGQQTTVYATGGTNYTWTPAVGISNSHDATIDVQPNTTTVYTVTGTNNNLCPGTATVQVIVNPLPVVNAGLDTTINIDNTVTLFGTGNVEVGFLSPNGIPLSCNYCSTITVNPQDNTCYTLEGINQYGCRNTDVVCVTVTKDWDVFIPNAFTPNGDLINEVFIPMGYAISEINLQIFDRWGHQIFKSHDDVIGWDGTNKGRLCEQGVYIYKAEITAMSGEKRYKTGHVTLLPRIK
jgi:gliding motility-associated-like protein